MNNVPTPLEYLEYDEENYQDDDIFGSDHEDGQSASGPSSVPAFNTAKPLSANKPDPLISDPSSSSSRKGKERARAKDPQDRLDELRFMRLPKPTQARTGQGVKPLRDITMSVIKQNSTRIWDIGDLEYRVIAEFLHELPMEQLAEIEGASPHIRKDTDWLWEYFLLKDYPLFYDQCKEKGGEMRSSGWRRMYKKALEDAANRKATAADRMQQRYKELEEAKQSRKIVVVDKLTVPTKGKAARGRQGGMVFAKAGQPRPTAPTSAAAPKGIFGKARAEASRAKVALTHASGKFDPKVANRLANPVRKPQQASSLFSMSRPVDSPPRTVVNGPRIPASRAIKGPNKRNRDSDEEHEAPVPSPLPGARPHVVQRSTLPASIVNRPEPSPTATNERFKLDPGRLETIKRPRVENFEPPRPPTAALSLGQGRTSSGSSLPSRSSPSAGPPRRTATPTEEAARLNSVLFVKKKAPRPAARST